MEAARELGVETIIIRRPYSVSVAHHDTVDETMSAIVAKLDHDTKRFA
jgi:precorrin-6x reductase